MSWKFGVRAHGILETQKWSWSPTGNIISKLKKKGPTSFFSLQINFNGKFERITNPKKNSKNIIGDVLGP